MLPVHVCYPRSLDAELFVRGKWAVPGRSQKGLRIGGEVESVGTTCQSNDGSSSAQVRSEQHDVFVLMLDRRRVVNRLYRVGDLGPGEDGVVRVASDNFRLHDRLASSSKILL